MRILHVIQELRTGGAERVVLALARASAAAGHDVAVASGPGELVAGLEAEHFALPLLERRPARVPAAALRLARALRAWQPNLVHCHNPGMAAVTSLPTLRGRRPPALVSVHGVPESDWKTTARVLRVAGLRVVACGPGVREALEEHGTAPLATIPNGVSAPPAAAPRAELERAWRATAGRAVAVSVGRLVATKNHALAIRAVTSLPDVALLIVGEGPLRGELVALANEQGIADRVVLAGRRDDARELIAAADVVVVPSRAEGLPMVVLETLAAGRPLVATAVRGVREILTDGRHALLVPDDDERALATAIRRVVDDRALAQRLGAAAHELASRFTEEKMVAEYLALYGSVAGT